MSGSPDSPAPSVRRLSAAMAALAARSDEIAACALEAASPLSDRFSKKENARTTDLSVAFMEAVAGTESTDDLVALRPEIARLQEHVTRANEAVAEHVRENPLVLTGFVNALATLFRLLLDADPTIRVAAGFGTEHKGVVRSVMTAFLTDLRQQLEASEGRRASRLARGTAALVNGLGTLINREVANTFAQYAEETRKELRTTRKEIIRAYQAGPESVETLSGPRSEEKRAQVRRVIVHLASSRTSVSIADACRATFAAVPGGYATAHELYVWCHRNEAKILRMVDELRLV